MPPSPTHIPSLLDNFVETQMTSTPDDLDLSHVLQSVIASASSNQNPDEANFPQPLDDAQPIKSWWHYFQKRTHDNTAVCYTCGAMFNRGPKQSTTSLSHHLKMYHRDYFIALQQAKDAALQPRLVNGRIYRNEGVNTPSLQKANQTVMLIEAVRERQELLDAKVGSDSPIKAALWQSVAAELGEGVTALAAKKRWIQVRDRFRKEYKFAVRDHFAYSPKWPYFADMRWYEPYIMSTRSRPHSSTPKNDGYRHPEAPPPHRHTSPEGGSSDESINASESMHSDTCSATGMPFHENPSSTPPVGTVVNWGDDEDMLFARFVGVRLRAAALPKKREAQRAILALLDDALGVQ
uniref:MADF domain-containing protein n=1 Tax=Panagrellus redivivus TaxID=6233 RepID=A0A7E4ZQE9_PANRE